MIDRSRAFNCARHVWITDGAVDRVIDRSSSVRISHHAHRDKVLAFLRKLFVREESIDRKIGDKISPSLAWGRNEIARKLAPFFAAKVYRNGLLPLVQPHPVEALAAFR